MENTRDDVERTIRELAEDVFGSSVEGVSYYDSLSNAPTKDTGKYVTVFISESSVTSEELDRFTENGFHFIEQAGHTTKNPDMDDSITTVPLDKLTDAAEVDTELILEVGSQHLS